MKIKFNYQALFLIIKIIISGLLGLFTAAYIAQKQTNFQRIITQKIYTILQDSHHDYQIDFKINQLNLLRGSFQIKDLVVLPKKEALWSWSCDEINLKFSWFNLLVNQKIKTKINIDKIKVCSAYQQNQLAIMSHISQILLAPSKVAIELECLNIKNGEIHLWHQEQNLNANISWASKTKNILNHLRSTIYLKSGQLSINNHCYLNQTNGQIQISLPLTGNNINQIYAKCDLSFAMPNLTSKDQFFLAAKWQNQFGAVKLSSLNGSINFKPINIQRLNDAWQIALDGQLNLNLLNEICQKKRLAIPGGTANLGLIATIANHDYQLNSDLVISNLTFNEQAFLETIKIELKKKRNLWEIDFKAERDLQSSFDCELNWDTDYQTGNCQLFYQNMQSKLACFSSNLKILDQKLYCNGQINYPTKDHIVAIFNQNFPYLEKLEFTNILHDKAYLLLENQNKQIKTTCDLELINQYLPNHFKSWISGTGKLLINTQFSNQQIINDIKLVNGNLVLPKIYNVIKDFTGIFNFNLNTQELVIKDSIVDLHKGQVKIINGKIRPNYIYLPVFFNSFAVNLDRNLIANLSGQILYQKQELLPAKIKGFMAIERALCRYNLLSNDLTKLIDSNHGQVFKKGLNLDLDLNVLTLSPIKIKSEFLETNANVQLSIANNISDPQIMGQINMIGGKINFPHKPLYLKTSTIYFTEEQPDQPIIDLIAKNQIKQYLITMYIGGSLYNPYITLESSPNLTEEQIGTLLLLGTENTSLNMIMPAIMMQNINSMVFGSVLQEEQTNHIVKKLFRPLDHVKFVPSFSDETGRGGLKGAVEVDINDRLHASIQKNFSLTEDTKLEIDYAITDDVSVRLIKDERGDLGGEFEIRLKA